MTAITRVRVGSILAALTVVALVVATPARVSAQTAAPPANAAAHATPGAPGSHADPAPRDGQHDFDWIIGTWKAHLSRLVNPLTGSTTWVEYDGVSTARKVWDGRANLDEFITESADKKLRMEGLTLRLYNPETRQWSLYWANAKAGALAMPPTVGHFSAAPLTAGARGEFYDQEDFQGRAILVRYVWSDITATSAKFEQAFSADWGKTWEPNWISTITRVKE